MKTLLIISIIATTALSSNYLHTAEHMTPAEIRTLRACEEKVLAAQADLAAVKAAIGRAHGMTAERYPEWSTTVETDGDYVLTRFFNHMY